MSTWVDLPGWLLYLWKLQEPKALSTSRVAVSVHAGFDRANLTFLHALLLQDEDSFRSDKPRLHELQYQYQVFMHLQDPGNKVTMVARLQGKHYCYNKTKTKRYY